MEKENNFVGEQPKEICQTLTAEEQQNETVTNDGSPISKFKSVQELEKAYKNLEKEFTQKCQKIKELTDELSASDNAKFNQKDSTESASNEVAPEYESDDWEEMVLAFFSQNPTAKNYVQEISEVLENDEEIAKSKNSLQVALTKVLANKFVPQEVLASDDEFLEKFIYTNEKVSKKIIEKYLDDLEEKKSLPLISSSSGSGTFSSPVQKPKTIKDAGKMVEAYFKN